MNRNLVADILVIGAGPYGLSIVAEAKRCGREVVVVGEPMAFWKHNMPNGMLLRSGRDWHLDAAEIHTFDSFLDEERIPRKSGEPIPVEIFRRYADWFCMSKKIEVQSLRIARLRRVNGAFEAECESGETICARHVVATPGLEPFANVPTEFVSSISRDRISHTATLVDFRSLAGRRCLIVGGRQSAFEWAALIAEVGADSVDIVYRHETPQFTTSDWSFTDSIIENTLRVPGWFRRLGRSEQEAIEKRFWTVGRLQLEPWLAGRVQRKNIRLWPNSRLVKWSTNEVGIEAQLEGGEKILADKAILATGYRVDLSKVRYLVEEVASGRLKLNDGYPALDDHFQTSLPGLYITGQAATRDFGPCFGFVRGCIASARIVASALQRGRFAKHVVSPVLSTATTEKSLVSARVRSSASGRR
jgi:cation diffusion facilitator CzcD-associated flavoprotein CzcO